MAIKERKLHQSKGILGVVKCVLMQVTLHRNKTRDIPGYIDKEVNYPATAAMMLGADDNCVAEWLDVEPSVINYRFRKNGEVFVNLSNLTAKTVTIAPCTVLCELQLVTIEDDVFQKNEVKQKKDKVLADLNLDHDQILTDEQRQEVRDLMQINEDLFSVHDTDLGNC